MHQLVLIGEDEPERRTRRPTVASPRLHRYASRHSSQLLPTSSHRPGEDGCRRTIHGCAKGRGQRARQVLSCLPPPVLSLSPGGPSSAIRCTLPAYFGPVHARATHGCVLSHIFGTRIFGLPICK